MVIKMPTIKLVGSSSDGNRTRVTHNIQNIMGNARLTLIGRGKSGL